jgi:tetratricopeptide (TPR) repeat protein
VDLNHKRRCLKSLLDFARRIEWPRLVSSGALQRHPIDVLSHAVQLFIRCQDGLVMLTSGECRHKYDIQDANNSISSSNYNKSKSCGRYKFKSRLPTLEKRGDGYTSLYKKDATYTGYGWDEYANETVGIRARLINELKKVGHKDPWGAFERQSRTELLESLLSQHELEMNNIQQDLQKWKRQLMDDIQTQLRPTNLKFVSQDKMERLSMVFNNQSLEFERRANSFQIDGPLLPQDKIRPDDWKKSLSLELSTPTSNRQTTRYPQDGRNNRKENASLKFSKPREKRRIIVESDDDEDDIHNAHDKTDDPIHVADKDHAFNKNGTVSLLNNEKKGTTTGLRVRVANTEHETGSGHSSVAAIKVGMGVDVNQLETARESLEQETLVRGMGRREGDGVESSEDNVISREERDLLTRERILKRVMSRQVVDENEVWDAREYLRQSCMAAGNYFLWELPNYARSVECFERAKALTEEQQSAHEKSIESSNDFDTVESRITSRNLLYLLGQATVNIGIVMIVSAEGDTNRMRRNGRKAIENFEAARVLTRDIIELTKAGHCGKNCPSQRFSISIEDVFDALKARELDCMASRWMADALWSTGQESRAMDVLEEASNTYDERNINLNCCELVDVIDLAGECIYAADKLAELAYTRLKKICKASPMSPAAKSKGDELMAKIRKALDRHIEIVQSIDKFGGRFDADSDIPSVTETLSSLNEITSWWNRTKDGRNASDNCTTITRADLFSIPAPDFLSGNRSDTCTRTINSRGQGTDSYLQPTSSNKNETRRRAASPFTKRSRSFGVSTTAGGISASVTSATTPIVYRKWGDELVKEKNNGVIPYPTTAPPLPSEFQALLDMKKVTVATRTKPT